VEEEEEEEGEEEELLVTKTPMSTRCSMGVAWFFRESIDEGEERMTTATAPSLPSRGARRPRRRGLPKGAPMASANSEAEAMDVEDIEDHSFTSFFVKIDPRLDAKKKKKVDVVNESKRNVNKVASPSKKMLLEIAGAFAAQQNND